MKSALALIFFACIAGSMAADVSMAGQLLQQGQVIAQAVMGQLQQQILQLVQQAVGQLSSLVGSIGGRFDVSAILSGLFDQFKPTLEGLATQALAQLVGGLGGIFGGSRVDVSSIFSGFLAEIQGTLQGIFGHVLNQGLASVLGGLGGRGIGDLFASLNAQISAAVTAAQGALGGALGNLSALGSNLLDASKPHWEQLQGQLVGHGLNVLGSVSETINNLHGSITTGR